MSEGMIDTLTRRLAMAMDSRRGLLRLGAGAALAGLALSEDEAAAACRKPKKACAKGNQCCTGKCKQGKCATCAHGASFLSTPDPLCWLPWGNLGIGDGEFALPNGVAVGGAGQVYVADTGNHRVQEFDPTGGFVRAWGSEGGDDGQFNYPLTVAVGGAGQVYVADVNNDRIQEFDAAAGFVRQWGGDGNGDGELRAPHGLAVGGGGRLYVADTNNHRVQEFDPTRAVGEPGFVVRTWGREGRDEEEFLVPEGVAVGDNGHLYVADSGNNRIKEFDATKPVGDPGFFVRGWGSNGSGDGQFDHPTGVSVGTNGHVFVADTGNDRIQEFTATGGFVRTWGGAGSGDGRFDGPNGVAVGRSGHVYIADTGNDRIVRAVPL